MSSPANTGVSAPMMGSSRLAAGVGSDVQEPANSLQNVCNGQQTTAQLSLLTTGEPERAGTVREQQYIRVREQAPPIPMRARSFVCGGCGGPCFYCGKSLRGEYHEHDHMPFPWRHGGREGVPARIACHDLNQTQQPISQTCDICHTQIESDERFHDDGDEIAHTHCIAGWFSSSFGREVLR